MKKIVVKTSVYQNLIKIFDKRRETVSAALNFRTNSDLARRIRVAAMKNGGELVGGGVREIPNPTFETAEYTMTFEFANEVVLVANAKTGEVVITISGKREVEKKIVTIEELCQLQALAFDMSKALVR